MSPHISKKQRPTSDSGWPLLYEWKNYSVLAAAFFLSFFSFRSCFSGLHFSQDLPSLCAATQHLCVHSLPAAEAFSQQVLSLSFSPAMAEPTRRETVQAIILSTLISFIFYL